MTKINRPYLALPLLTLVIGCPMPMPVTPDEPPAPIVYEAEAGGETLTVAALSGEWASVAVAGEAVRFRVAPDQTFPPPEEEAPNITCPCPDFALNHHPEDPDSPGECKARSRTGMVMDAEDHPACAREAREWQ